MGISKARRAAKERLKNKLRCSNSGQFARKDDEESDTDQMCLEGVVVEELTESLVAVRQHEQDALTAAQDAVNTMQMMYGMEQNDVESLLRDMEGNEISVSDYFNRELELREVDPEEDDPEDEDDPEVFVIDEKEESRDEIIATESWKFLKAATTRWKQPRKIMQQEQVPAGRQVRKKKKT